MIPPGIQSRMAVKWLMISSRCYPGRVFIRFSFPEIAHSQEMEKVFLESHYGKPKKIKAYPKPPTCIFEQYIG